MHAQGCSDTQKLRHRRPNGQWVTLYRLRIGKVWQVKI